MKAAIIGYGKMGREIERILAQRGTKSARRSSAKGTMRTAQSRPVLRTIGRTSLRSNQQGIGLPEFWGTIRR